MTDHGELSLTLEDHEKAFTEVSFLVEMLVRTAGEVVGRSLPSLGTNAGRNMGRKLPIYLPSPTLDAVQKAVAERLAAGFAMEGKADGSCCDLKVGRCAIREVCRDRKAEVGGEICRMFHYYLAGQIAQLLGKPVRVGAVTPGETCSVRLDAQG